MTDGTNAWRFNDSTKEIETHHTTGIDRDSGEVVPVTITHGGYGFTTAPTIDVRALEEAQADRDFILRLRRSYKPPRYLMLRSWASFWRGAVQQAIALLAAGMVAFVVVLAVVAVAAFFGAMMAVSLLNGGGLR